MIVRADPRADRRRPRALPLPRRRRRRSGVGAIVAVAAFVMLLRDRRRECVRWLSRPFTAAFISARRRFRFGSCCCWRSARSARSLRSDVPRTRAFIALLLFLRRDAGAVPGARPAAVCAVLGSDADPGVLACSAGAAHASTAWRYLIYNFAGGLTLLLATAAFGVVNGSTDVIGRADMHVGRHVGSVDLRRLRVCVLGQDAGVAAAHLDAGDVQPSCRRRWSRWSAPCSRRPDCTVSSRSCWRSCPTRCASRAAAVRARCGLAALRRIHRARAKRRQAHRGVLVALAPGLDRDRDFQLQPDRAAGRAGLHRRARAVHGGALPDARLCRRARGDAVADRVSAASGEPIRGWPARCASPRWRRSGCPAWRALPARSSSSPASITAGYRWAALIALVPIVIAAATCCGSSKAS